ncbi:DUF6807 domain-containing protein [Jiangella endophytica]|uniref:DUF6807 domain-containing protein n=1 Tax=Jiangella endophytica TaxID=1623398 RepID=UPI000E34312C|nr:PmoA family protein [Jiangella endophytica]
MRRPGAADTITQTLEVGGIAVAEYVIDPSIERTLSPRPYLHPVRTLGGVVVTDLVPDDHRHHLGLSLAVADLDGTTFWGGRTFVAGRGPTPLDNHGTQRHDGFSSESPSGITDDLTWLTRAGEPLVRETRSVRATDGARPGAWSLTWTSALTNVAGRDLRVASPAVNGRPGAGYGGIFWRVATEAGTHTVKVAEGSGEQVAHGSTSPWLLLSGRSAADRPWSLWFSQEGTPEPWFVRMSGYVGAGPALAWSQPLVLAAGAVLERQLTVVVADGELTP